MSWIPLIALLGAVVIAAVVLGYCAYEIAWRTRRLKRDVHQVQELVDGFAQLRSHLAGAHQRLERASVG